VIIFKTSFAIHLWFFPPVYQVELRKLITEAEEECVSRSANFCLAPA
jgi:hypothetical protein